MTSPSELIAELERLEKAATAAPWKVAGGCMVPPPDLYEYGHALAGESAADQEFIAALRNAAPKLFELARLGLEAESKIAKLGDICDSHYRGIEEREVVIATLKSERQALVEFIRRWLDGGGNATLNNEFAGLPSAVKELVLQ